MTVTEKGYCLSVDGILDLKNRLVEAELPVGAPPKSAWGVIYAALALRVRRKVRPPLGILLRCPSPPVSYRIAPLPPILELPAGPPPNTRHSRSGCGAR
jgi:hypothetical protein